MNCIDLDTTNFAEIISRKGIVLVDAGAAWCGPCRGFEPIFSNASERHSEHVFAKLDTQAEKELRLRLGIELIPSLLIYRDGILLYRSPGSPPAEMLDALVAEVETLDMDEIREELERFAAVSRN